MTRRLPQGAGGSHRKWGQNFLVNAGACETIIRAFAPRPDDRVLEIGPGRGALTRRLLGRVECLMAIEVDPDLASVLRQDLQHSHPEGRFDLIEGDVLAVDLGALLDRLGDGARSPCRVIANLPYNIATAVILRLLPLRGTLRDLFVMVQREVAERMASPPGRKSYGSLSVLCQTYALVEPILTLGPGSFQPRPKVDSAVIRMTLRNPGGAVARSHETFVALVRAAFEQRRKTLLNNLARLRPAVSPSAAAAGAPLGRPAAEALILGAGLDPRRRAEEIPVGGFLALAETFAAPPGRGGYNAHGDHPLPQ